VVNGEMSLRRLKLPAYEVVKQREEEEAGVITCYIINFTELVV
jgi:hypothetical protein